MKQDLDIEQAQQLILQNISRMAVHMLPISAAIDRVLAQDMAALQDLPGEPQSAVDGFALGDDSGSVNSRFTLKGFLQPGVCPREDLIGGEAMGVRTGAALPFGTGAVVPHEKTQIEGETLIVKEEIKPGNNIKQPGEDYHQGEILGKQGTVIDPGYISLLAAMGISSVPVHALPRVAILGLGKNVIEHSRTPVTGQTRDSNGPMLTALVQRAGGQVIACELTAQLNAEQASRRLSELLQQSDAVITTGGTYAEIHGEARGLLESMKAEIVYWGTNVQPGSHNGLAICNKVPVFSLSGNPAACAVGFQLLVAPALHYMQGKDFACKTVQAVCSNNFNKAARSRRMVRGRARVGENGWEVEVLPGQKPSMHKSLLNCNALIDMEPGHPPLQAGSIVNIVLLEGGTVK